MGPLFSAHTLFHGTLLTSRSFRGTPPGLGTSAVEGACIQGPCDFKLLTRFTPKFRSVKKLKVTFPRNRSTHLPCDATRARPRSARACSVRRAVVVSHLESKLFSRIKATLHSCTRSNDDYLQSRPSSGKLGERTVDFELERKRACTRARARGVRVLSMAKYAFSPSDSYPKSRQVPLG